MIDHCPITPLLLFSIGNDAIQIAASTSSTTTIYNESPAELQFHAYVD